MNSDPDMYRGGLSRQDVIDIVRGHPAGLQHDRHAQQANELATLRERVRAIELQLGINVQAPSAEPEVDRLRTRIDRIERRLGLRP